MILLFVALSHLCNAQSCLTGGITFNSQEEIDDFPMLYPNCTTIDGDVKIGDFTYPYLGTDIVDLSGLNNINQINGSLDIFYNADLVDLLGLSNLAYVGLSLSIDNNDALVDLEGLENLNTINGQLTVKSNEGLISLSGLENITSIDNSIYVSSNPSLLSFEGLNGLLNVNGYFSIANNNGLLNFQGLESLTTIGSFVHIWNNDNLMNFQGLESLNAIEEFFSISDNNNLDNIDGIINLQSIGNYLSIHNNEMLTSIQGMENINPETISASSINQNDIEIYNNINLTSCAMENVCSVFNTQESKIFISNNGIDCDSSSDIDSICNPYCGFVDNKNSSGVGSLTYAIECVLANDTIYIDEALGSDTIWLSESSIDLEKSFVIKGPNSRLMIATTLGGPLLKNYAGEQIHLMNIDLYKFDPVIDNIIYNQGKLILENCDIHTNSHKINISDSGQFIVRGATKIF